ncbi:MAG TPA: Stp1/IreP family PP2C-type Ser/Thr phosphatase [Coriobacteriia bacterium]
MTTTPGTSAAAGADLPELSWALRSHPGAVRSDNEDFVGAYSPHVIEDHGPLFVVCDGMGGHAAGEVASRMAVETVLTTWTTASPSPTQQAVRSAIRHANSAVFGASLDVETRGMGTTCTALALSGNEGFVGNVGDSRCYLVHRGQCSQLTADHSKVGEMLRMRLITPEQAANHPSRSQLTRSLGAAPGVQVDIVRTPVHKGDSFVLCSDGVWDLVSRQEIAQVCGLPSVADGAEKLIELSLERGAPDNVTVLVVRVSGEVTQLAADKGRNGGMGFLQRLGLVRGSAKAEIIVDDESA